jgi:hypothetical protein
MWVLRYLRCLLLGHSYHHFTFKGHPYQYCMHCERIGKLPYVIAE